MMAKYQIVYLNFEANLNKIVRLFNERQYRYKAKGFYSILKISQTRYLKEKIKIAHVLKFEIILSKFSRNIESINIRSVTFAFDLMKYSYFIKSIDEVKHLKARLMIDRLKIGSGKKSSKEALENLTLEKLTSQLSFDRPINLFRKKKNKGSCIEKQEQDSFLEIRRYDQENELLELKIKMTEEYAQNFIDRINKRLDSD